MSTGGCEGCKDEIIRNRTQKNWVKIEAENYTKNNKVNTIVFFDGKDYIFEEKKQDKQYINVIACYYTS